MGSNFFANFNLSSVFITSRHYSNSPLLQWKLIKGYFLAFLFVLYFGFTDK